MKLWKKEVSVRGARMAIGAQEMKCLSDNGKADVMLGVMNCNG